jgi:hypothetical protein
MKLLRYLLNVCIFLALTLWASFAFALAAPDPDVTPGWVSVLIGLASVLGTALLALLKWALGKLFDFFAEKSKLVFLAQIDEVLMGIVTDLYNTQVEHWKNANEDGKLSDAEKARAKDLAVESLKAVFDPEKLEALFNAAGGDLDKALGARVELAKTAAQNAGKAARKVDPTPK